MTLEAAVQSLADAIRYAADKQAGNMPNAATVGLLAKPTPPATVVAATQDAPKATPPPRPPAAAKAPPAPPVALAATANGAASPLRKTAKELVQKVAAAKGREVAVGLINAVQDGTPGTITNLAEENLQAFVDAATQTLAEAAQ